MTRQLTTEERAAFAEMLEPHHEYLAQFCNRLCRSDGDNEQRQIMVSVTRDEEE